MLPKNIQTANKAWIQNLSQLLHNGQAVDVGGSNPSGGETLEIPSHTSYFDMRYPLVTVRKRKLNYSFACAEAWWIISGKNSVKEIAKYNSKLLQFTDDQETLWGAYGPRFVEQLPYIIDCLSAQPHSRQAVCQIWRPSPPKTKDCPCTLSIQWLIRNGGLHCIDTMRSSDIWLGWPYDVFVFTMVSGYVALKLREATGIEYPLRSFTLTAGSQHLYNSNIDTASDIFSPISVPDGVDAEDVMEVSYEAFNPFTFNSPEHLLRHLKLLADKQSALADNSFLVDLGVL